MVLSTKGAYDTDKRRPDGTDSGIRTSVAECGRVLGALPITGATRASYVLENCRPVNLDAGEMARLQRKPDEMASVGRRYPDVFHEHLDL